MDKFIYSEIYNGEEFFLHFREDLKVVFDL